MHLDIKIMLKCCSGFSFRYLHEIVYFKACDKYVEMYTIDGSETTIFHSLKEMEERLCCGTYIGSMIFFRIHRSYIAAMHHATSWLNSGVVLNEIKNPLPVGDTQSKELRRLLLQPYNSK